MKAHLVAVAVSMVVAAAVPAQAAQRTFVGTAAATALKLTVTEPGGEPQGITFGASTALVQSSPSAECDGTACATSAAAVEPFGETARVVAASKPRTDSAEGFAVPEELAPILSGALGTATVSAEPAPGPVATAGATAGELQVHVAQSLIGPIQDDLDDAVEEVVDGLEPILGPVQGGDPTGLTDQVETLLRDLADALADNPLTVVRVGASTADAQDAPGTGLTSATAVAEGAVIELAPVDSVAADGLFRIEAGASTATVSTDGTKITKSSKGSVVKVSVADLTTPAPDDYQAVDVATDQPEQCFGESPLLLCIIIGGTAEEASAGGAAATAAAVRIRAFADADAPDADNPLPGVTLAVAESVAGVNAGRTAVISDPPDPSADPDSPELPSTGGGLGALGLAVLGAGALTLRALRRP